MNYIEDPATIDETRALAATAAASGLFKGVATAEDAHRAIVEGRAHGATAFDALRLRCHAASDRCAAGRHVWRPRPVRGDGPINIRRTL